MSDESPSRPAARSGIKGSIAAEQAIVEGSDAEAARSNMPGAQLQVGSTEAESRLQPSASALNPNPTPAGNLGRPQPSTGFGEQELDPTDFADKERLSCILEALHAHRAILHGLLARKNNEASLNPASKEAELGAIERGIARAEVLIGELTAAD